MPPKKQKNKSRRYKRKQFRRRFRTGDTGGNATAGQTTGKGQLLSRPSVGYQKTLLPFPPRYIAQFSYTSTQPLTANQFTNAASCIYRLNSCHDPDQTNVGAQPYQWDTMKAIYSTYRVISAKVKITFWDPSHDGLMVGYRIRSSQDTTATNGQTISLLSELPHVKFAPLLNTGKQGITWSGKVDMHKVLGLSKTQYDDVTYLTSTVANGTTDVLLEPFVADIDNGNTHTCKVTVALLQTVELSGYYCSGES